MKTAIRKHRWDFIAVLGIFVIALVVGGYILGHQRFYLPKWVPVVGTDFVDYKAEFATAQSVTPGQGQSVNIAGVPVGEIAKVELKDGRAVVTMKIRRKYAHVYKDATALLRPKTGLNDMVVELTPGTRRAGEIDHAKQIDPDHPDAAQRQHRRVPRGAGRRHAQLPAAAGRRRRRGARRQRQEPVGDLPPLRADQPRHREDHQGAGGPPRQHRAARSTTSGS